MLVGLTLRHDAGDIFRAVLEGTALAVRNNLEAMRDLGVAIDQATAVGGGTQAREWVQIVSDVTGIPQVIPRSTVGASFGMAMLAARASGLNVEVDEWNPAAEVVVPDESHRSLYDDRYRLFVELYRATAPVVHSLAASER